MTWCCWLVFLYSVLLFFYSIFLDQDRKTPICCVVIYFLLVLVLYRIKNDIFTRISVIKFKERVIAVNENLSYTVLHLSWCKSYTYLKHRQWQSFSVGFTGSQCCIRKGRSQHFTRPTGKLSGTVWHRIKLVWILFKRQGLCPKSELNMAIQFYMLHISVTHSRKTAVCCISVL